MRVVITGAGGRLGEHCLAEISGGGFDVVGCDVRPVLSGPVRVETMDLRDAGPVAEFLKGADAVVHLGNHPGPLRGMPARTFDENVTMNMNVFQAALDRGARKIVFASSIQVSASEPAEGQPVPPDARPPYLPLDGDCPPRPTNTYALSKWIGEVILRDFVAKAPVECVALRFPLLLMPNPAARNETRRPPSWPPPQDPPPYRIAQGISFLSYPDAARLIHAALRSSLPGFRTYLPALSSVPPDRITEAVSRYYANVPLKCPIEQFGSLVDISRITRETGWQPLDADPAILEHGRSPRRL